MFAICLDLMSLKKFMTIFNLQKNNIIKLIKKMRFLRQNIKNFIQQYTTRILMRLIYNKNKVKNNIQKLFLIKKFMLRIFSTQHKVYKTTKTLEKTVF